MSRTLTPILTTVTFIQLILFLDWAKAFSADRKVGGGTWTEFPNQWLSLQDHYKQPVGSIQCTKRARETGSGKKNTWIEY